MARRGKHRASPPGRRSDRTRRRQRKAGSAGELKALYEKRFQEITKRYRDHIKIWDVANESLVRKGGFPFYSKDRAYVPWAFHRVGALFSRCLSVKIESRTVVRQCVPACRPKSYSRGEPIHDRKPLHQRANKLERQTSRSNNDRRAELDDLSLGGSQGFSYLLAAARVFGEWLVGISQAAQINDPPLPLAARAKLAAVQRSFSAKFPRLPWNERANRPSTHLAKTASTCRDPTDQLKPLPSTRPPPAAPDSPDAASNSGLACRVVPKEATTGRQYIQSPPSCKPMSR